MSDNFTPEMFRKIFCLNDREKGLVMLALELQERLNKATDVALHYNPCPDSYKSCNDHIDEVHAHLKHDRTMKPKKHYSDVEKTIEEMGE